MDAVCWDYISSFLDSSQKTLKYSLIDMERIRRLDLASDSYGTSPREGTDSNQIYHETETEPRRHTVEIAKLSKHSIVCDARPALLATRDQAEAIVERHARLDLQSLYQLLCLDLNDFNPELCALRRRYAPYLIKHGCQNDHPSYMLHYEFEDFDLRLAVVNEHICVGEKHGLGHSLLSHPLTCLPPHLLPSQPQNLGGAPEGDMLLFKRLSHEPREAVLDKVVPRETLWLT